MCEIICLVKNINQSFMYWPLLNFYIYNFYKSAQWSMQGELIELLDGNLKL